MHALGFQLRVFMCVCVRVCDVFVCGRGSQVCDSSGVLNYAVLRRRQEFYERKLKFAREDSPKVRRNLCPPPESSLLFWN